MSTSLKWNASDSREVSTVSRVKWKELGQGYTTTWVGHVALFVFLMPAVLLLAPPGVVFLMRLGLEPSEANLLGKALLVAGASLGYLVILAGQWRCLLHAPQGHGAKDFQFAALLSLLAVPICLATGHFMGGPKFYALLNEGFRDLRPLALAKGAGVPFGLSVALAVCSVFLSTCVAQAVAQFHKDARLSRSITAYFWYILFLIGGTGGVLIAAQRQPRLETWGLLALLWAIFLAWNTYLTYRSAGAVAALVRRLRSGVHMALVDTKVEPKAAYGQVNLKTQAFQSWS